MQDGITYMCNKAYQRGLKHSFMFQVTICLVVGFVAFNAGRTYEYVKTIEAGAKVIQEMKIN